MPEVHHNYKTTTRKHDDNGEHLTICTMGGGSYRTNADWERPNEISGGSH